jgi:hypothetical protein
MSKKSADPVAGAVSQEKSSELAAERTLTAELRTKELANMRETKERLEQLDAKDDEIKASLRWAAALCNEG